MRNTQVLTTTSLRDDVVSALFTPHVIGEEEEEEEEEEEKEDVTPETVDTGPKLWICQHCGRHT